MGLGLGLGLGSGTVCPTEAAPILVGGYGCLPRAALNLTFTDPGPGPVSEPVSEPGTNASSSTSTSTDCGPGGVRGVSLDGAVYCTCRPGWVPLSAEPSSPCVDCDEVHGLSLNGTDCVPCDPRCPLFGTCSRRGVCVCSPGRGRGRSRSNDEDGDVDCSRCAPGYVGPECAPCPLDCGLHGVCAQSPNGSTICRCAPGWTGDTCGACAPGASRTSTGDCVLCSPPCRDANRVCDPAQTGAGSLGRCVCAPGWSGPDCTVCASGTCDGLYCSESGGVVWNSGTRRAECACVWGARHVNRTDHRSPCARCRPGESPGRCAPCPRCDVNARCVDGLDASGVSRPLCLCAPGYEPPPWEPVLDTSVCLPSALITTLRNDWNASIAARDAALRLNVARTDDATHIGILFDPVRDTHHDRPALMTLCATLVVFYALFVYVYVA